MNKTWDPVGIAEPTDDAIRASRISHETMLVSILDAIIERYERDPAYPFIDTKLNLITGEDFAPAHDATRDFKSKRVVYGWIQGRGLEALAGHAQWLPECSVLSEAQKHDRIERLKSMIGGVLNAMETLRALNHGRVTFMMTTKGQPLEISDHGTLEPIEVDPDAKAFSDLFYSKGLYAAAHCLGLEAKTAEAETYFRDVLTRIEVGGFVTDQQSFDPKNKVCPVPGRKGQGPHMIGLFGISMVAGTTGSTEWLDRGCRFIRHILDHHVNLGQHPGLQPYDFIEAIDEADRPWVDDGAILCDPGHALECVGAMAWFLLVARQLGTAQVSDPLVDECRRVLPRVLIHVFGLAWNAAAGGSSTRPFT